MTEIVLVMHRGPDGQPVGTVRRGLGPTTAFTGWLDLIRLLEAELRGGRLRPGHRGRAARRGGGR